MRITSPSRRTKTPGMLIAGRVCAKLLLGLIVTPPCRCIEAVIACTRLSVFSFSERAWANCEVTLRN